MIVAERHCGKPARLPILVRTPVRISFGGGGTDMAEYYERFGGLVISAAISHHAYAVAREPAAGGVHLHSADYGLSLSASPGVVPQIEEPLSLPKAVVEYFAVGKGGSVLRERGVDLYTACDIPPGTGLGSSSAMAVSLVQALAAYCGAPMTQVEAADTACGIEIGRLGMPIGRQDQYAAACGGINAISFTRVGVEVETLSLPPGTLDFLNARLMLFFTGRSRHSSSILRRQRSRVAGDTAAVEALHGLKELACEMRAALEHGQLDDFGCLLEEAWQTKKNLSGCISSPDIDRWHDAALAAGALGGKITGAGGGGFLLVYCPPERAASVRSAMAAQGLVELPFTFDAAGVTVVGGGGAGPDISPPAPAESASSASPATEPTLERSMSMRTTLQHYCDGLANTIQNIPHDSVARAGDLLLRCHQRRGTVFILGNGGSAATASHFACDLAKGTRAGGPATFRVIALTDNVAILTAWSNDTSYERVFAEQLLSLLQPGDTIVAISASGSSPNVIAAVRAAQAAGAATIALTGRSGGALLALADVTVRVPSDCIEQVEDAHLAISHALCVHLREHLLSAGSRGSAILLR